MDRESGTIPPVVGVDCWHCIVLCLECSTKNDYHVNSCLDGAMASHPGAPLALAVSQKRTSGPRLVLAWLIAVGVAALASVVSHSGSRPGSQFEPFVLTTFDARDLSRSSIELGSFDGVITLVNFWATWCGPCRAEIPDLIALRRRFGSSVRVIGVSVDEGDEKVVRDFAKRLGVDYPVVHWMGDTQIGFGRPDTLPVTYIVTPDRRVSYRFIGRINLETVARTIQPLLANIHDAQSKVQEKADR